MYSVDEKDRVVPIKDIPQSSIGAPIPIVLSDEFVTIVAFYLENMSDGWDGTSVRVVGKETEGEPLYHKPEIFLARKHYALSFHDSTFECVADGYIVELHESSVKKILPRMIELLH
jgi:hypothetical protein